MELALGLILGSDFNYDFHVSLDESTPVQYNYCDKEELERRRSRIS